jgi:hypothetical protein
MVFSCCSSRRGAGGLRQRHTHIPGKRIRNLPVCLAGLDIDISLGLAERAQSTGLADPVLSSDGVDGSSGAVPKGFHAEPPGAGQAGTPCPWLQQPACGDGH